MRDFYLEKDAAGRYSLAGVTEDTSVRLSARATLQFLSQQKPDSARGSEFASLVATGQLRTNSDLANAFAISASDVVLQLRTASYEVSPLGFGLLTLSIENFKKVNLTFEIITTQETVTTDITVGTST